MWPASLLPFQSALEPAFPPAPNHSQTEFPRNLPGLDQEPFSLEAKPDPRGDGKALSSLPTSLYIPPPPSHPTSDRGRQEEPDEAPGLGGQAPAQGQSLQATG